MLEISLFLLGFGLSIIGFVYIITYLNYLSIGYSLQEYLLIIFSKVECLFSLIGILIMTIMIFRKR